MKNLHTLYSQAGHQWLMVTRDPQRPDHLIDTNEYLVRNGGRALLTDPGGLEIFPAVFSAISREVDPSEIVALFASHQDPDIISSLVLWLHYKPDMKCYLSWLWQSFIPHFGGNADTFVPLADDGGIIMLGDLPLKAVPAHYLHSSGNFHLYDASAKILFSGDVGAALVEPDAPVVVKDFDAHIKAAEGFHRRWMGSNEAKNDWCGRASQLQIDMLCPQHGSVYQGKDVERFINWFADLKVGVLKHNGVS